MRHQYEQYKFRLLKDASGPEKNPENYDPTVFNMRLHALKKEYERRAETDPLFDQAGGREVQDYDVLSVMITANAEHALWRGEGIHTFVDPETEAVVHRAIANLSNEAMASFRPKVDIGVIYRSGKPPVMYNFASDDGKAACINDETMGVYRMDDLTVLPPDDHADAGLLGLRDSMRFIVGCFMMQECFPQIFQEGLPEFVKHPAWFRKLSSRGMQVDHVSKEVCPHIRRGHFRLLSSDRYINKKGQVVFVKASMVKGKAEHTDLKEIDAESSKE